MRTPAIRFPSLVASLAALAAGAALAQDPATNAPALAGADAMMGAKAAIAAALRPAPKPASAPVETNAWDRFQLAVRELERTQRARNGAVPAADWLAAVDLALAVPPGAKANLPTADRAQFGGFDEAAPAPALAALLSVFPATPDWDAVREGLRRRAEAHPAPPAGPLLLPALRTAAEFLGGGARGVPEEAFAPLAAAAVPDGVPTGLVAKARAALRRSMERPGERAPVPFSAARFARVVDRALIQHGEVVLPKEVAQMPDDAALPLLRRILAVEADADWYGNVVSWGSDTGAVARIAALAIAEPAAAGPLSWSLVEIAPDKRALFDALSSQRRPMDAIRAKIDAARAVAADDDEPDEDDYEDDEDGGDDPIDPDDPFSWNDECAESGRYCHALLHLVSTALDDGRADEAEALAAVVRPGDWKAVSKLGGRLQVGRPGEAWRAFLEKRLPAGPALLDSPLLASYAAACRRGAADRFEATVARLLGPAAQDDLAKKRLAGFRFGFARERGDLDALEPWFRAALDPAAAAALGLSPDYHDVRNWLRALGALGETNRIAAALDPLRAAAADEKNRWKDRFAALVAPGLANAGRFADAERFLVETGLAKDRANWEWRCNDQLAALYLRAGRPADAVAFAVGWPRWSRTTLSGACDSDDVRLVRALAEAGDETQKAAAAALARSALGERYSDLDEETDGPDPAFDALLAAAAPAEVLVAVEKRLDRNPFDARDWRRLAALHLRLGDPLVAEASARRAVALSRDPRASPDWSQQNEDRIASLETLAAALEATDGAGAAAEAAALRRSAAALRTSAKAEILRDAGFADDALRLERAAAALDPDNGTVRLRLAEALDGDEAATHYEAAYRALPSQLACALPTWWWNGFFPSSESVEAAERVLPALAAAPGAGAPVFFLLGELRAAQKRWDEAFAAYERAAGLDPRFLRAQDELLDLNGRVERPAAVWARAQVSLRRHDPFCNVHSEEARRIVDWAALWRAFDEAAADVPLPRDEPAAKAPVFRFEATARVQEAVAAARAGAEAAAAGADAEGGKPDAEAGKGGGERGGANNVRPDRDMPARLLLGNFDRDGGWGRRLVDVVSILSGGGPVSRNLGRNAPPDGGWRAFSPRYNRDSGVDAWCLGGTAGDASWGMDDADDYFSDDW